ncbi:MAG: hypothetical protein SWK76_15060 [Actinomycetota bacterium]|nr:hypothetical protein [Actinomycetota bacterium]
MKAGRSWAIVLVIACMITSSLLLLPGCGQEQDEGDGEEGLRIEELEVTVEADPENETLDMTAFIHIRRDSSIEECSFAFIEPTEVNRIYDVGSDRELDYEIDATPYAERGVYGLSIDLGECGEECTVGLTYRYDGQSFYAEDLNPSAAENLVLGQVTADSIYSSHLYYYPYCLGLAERATMRIVVPRGWVGLSSGNLVCNEDLQDGKTLYEYEIPFSSGRLPYPLAIFPYRVTETMYEDRLPVMIYSSGEDVPYAEEKLELITAQILPFLEEIMGPFPFDNLRIVEVFPVQGTTGLATKSLVMLSRETWFGAPIDGDYSRVPAIVLVDEIAHQWNYYKVMFPNYLAEGISQYTTDLFMERYVDPGILAENMESYRQSYAEIADLLNLLKSHKDSGETMEEASAQLNMSVEEIEPYWQYADYGEVPITDPDVYLPLYFIKGALAIDALREELGDETFFAGFRRLFSQGLDEEVTLEYFRECFESESGVSLDDFFRLWYLETGLPPGQ